MSAPASGKFFACAGLLLAVGLTGCGGGGNGNQSATTTTPPATMPATVTGTLQSASGTVLSGYTVVYDRGVVNDPNAVLTTTTNSTGTFTLTVPASDITGSDTLTFYSSTGGVAGVQSITPQSGQAVALTATTIYPPPMP